MKNYVAQISCKESNFFNFHFISFILILFWMNYLIKPTKLLS